MKTSTAVAAAFAAAVALNAQPQKIESNDLPNPYRTVDDHFKLPGGRKWGAISAVDIDKDGRSICWCK